MKSFLNCINWCCFEICIKQWANCLCVSFWFGLLVLFIVTFSSPYVVSLRDGVKLANNATSFLPVVG